MDKANYFLIVSRYIHLKPCAIKKNIDPVEYQGSSLQYYAHGGDPSFLTAGEILTRFKGCRKKEQKKADEIVKTVANYFGLSVEMMKTGRRLKGKGAISRKTLIVMILENLPCTHKQLAKYIGLNGIKAITYHLTTVKGKQKLTVLINELRRLVN